MLFLVIFPIALDLFASYDIMILAILIIITDKERRMRNSKQKEIILAAMTNNFTHPTADEVYSLLKADNPALSLATVYRNLNRFAQQGKIKKIAIPDAGDRFDCTVSPHFHAVCTECSRLTDVTLADTDEIEKRIMAVPEIQAESYNLIIYGVCKNCLDKKIESEETINERA